MLGVGVDAGSVGASLAVVSVGFGLSVGDSVGSADAGGVADGDSAGSPDGEDESDGDTSGVADESGVEVSVGDSSGEVEAPGSSLGDALAPAPVVVAGCVAIAVAWVGGTVVSGAEGSSRRRRLLRPERQHVDGTRAGAALDHDEVAAVGRHDGVELALGAEAADVGAVEDVRQPAGCRPRPGTSRRAAC